MPFRTDAAHAPHTDSREVGLRLLDHIDAMVAYWDVDRICIFANNAYIARYGKTREEIVGISQERLLGSLYQRNLAYIEAAYAGNRQVFERELSTEDGHTHFNLISYIPDIVDGIVRGIFVHIADVTSLKEAESELRQARDRAEYMATHDFLTGLPNRALLEDRISHAIALSRRRHQMVAVMSLDVDNFKRSTTPGAMRRVTSCCRSSPCACAARCANRTRPRAWAATSSCCSRRRSIHRRKSR